MKPSLIYLASPYTHSSQRIMHQRFEKVLEKTADLISQGYYVFSPIAYGHVMAGRYKMPTLWDYWIKFDEVFISRCDKLMVLKLQGWEKSKGVNAEVKLANKYKIPVEYLEDFKMKRKRKKKCVCIFKNLMYDNIKGK